MSDIVILNPRFDVTFLGLEHALPLLHKKATMPVTGLPLLARRDPAVLFGYVLKCAMHYHHYRMAREMAGDGSRLLNPY